jgi:cell wall-associated NlpC family hydrolase
MNTPRSSTEWAQRARVVKEAREFLGTPYHHRGLVKGAGIDCATLLYLSFLNAGLINELVLPPYSQQLHLHRVQSDYIDFIRQFAAEVTDRLPLPGDLVIWKFHLAFSHGAIVVNWPTIIHALTGVGCSIDDATQNRMLTNVSERVPTQGKPRPMKTFSYWGT